MWLVIELEAYGKVFSYHPWSMHPSYNTIIAILDRDYSRPII